MNTRLFLILLVPCAAASSAVSYFSYPKKEQVIARDQVKTLVAAPLKDLGPSKMQPLLAPKRSLQERESEPPKNDLIRNWDLREIGVPEEALAPFFSESQPEEIIVFGEHGPIRIHPSRVEEGGRQSQQLLFLATPQAIRKTAEERRRMAQEAGNRNSRPKPRDRSPLPANAYEIVSFSAGNRDSGDILVPTSQDFLRSIQGPDYSFRSISYSDDEALRENMSRVLSFGHGGQLVLRVPGDGALLDRPGADFVIFENAFRIGGTNLVFQEFAHVGVSRTLNADDVRWFGCDPARGEIRGCAGAVPTSEGGDHFDLAELGVVETNYIWIKDYGRNKNYPSKWPTEGVDLDALRLNYAFGKN